MVVFMVQPRSCIPYVRCLYSSRFFSTVSCDFRLNSQYIFLNFKVSSFYFLCHIFLPFEFCVKYHPKYLAVFECGTTCSLLLIMFNVKGFLWFSWFACSVILNATCLNTVFLLIILRL